jgi:predicted ATPase
VFDEKGVTVDIKPITILTGCNSSGKSSIVKSMVLLNTYIDKLQEDYNAFGKVNLKKHKLDFTKDTTMSLGNFDRVRHNCSEDKTITFQYQVHSLLMGEDVKVSLVFVSDDNDELKEGYLKEITILNLTDDIIYTSSEENPCSANYNLIVSNFFRFALGQMLAYLQNEYKYRRYHLYGLQTEGEFQQRLNEWPKDMKESQERKEKALNEFKSMVEFFFSSYVSSYGEDSLTDMQKWEKINGKDHYAFTDDNKKDPLIARWLDGHYEILDISLHWGTLFYFPLLEQLYNVDSSSFKDTLLKMIMGITNEEEVLYAIDKISNDFISSGVESFGDYFTMKEKAFLNFENKHFKRWAPYIGGTEFLKIGDGDNGAIIDGSYLQWTRRLLGLGFTEYEGNLVSLIAPGESEKWKECPVDFHVLYDVLMNIDFLLNRSDNIFFSKDDSKSNKRYHKFHHHLFDMFKEYASMVMEEVVTSAIPQNLSYIGTSLVSVKRDYSLDSNDNFAFLTKRYFTARRNYNNSKEKGILGTDNFISRWIQKLGLGYSVGIEVNPSGSSFAVRIYKSAEDTVGTILAEEGYGVTQIVTLLLRIETAILEAEKIPIRDYDEDGTRTTTCVCSESTIAIEEPEVHLHPKFQSLLAEMFVEAYEKYNVHFIVETHSEYLIRKLQLMVASDDYDFKGNEVSIGYIDKDERGKSINRSIEILEDGSLSESFGHGFYDEADTLAIELFKIKPILS